MSWVTWLNWVIIVEYAALGILGLVALVDWLLERAAWRRLMIHVWTQHPIANLAPPTMIELRRPDWIDAPDEHGS